MKILLPVDGSHHTKRMLSYLAAHEELLGAGHECVFLTAVAPLPSSAARALDHSIIEGHYQERADEVLKPVLAFAAQQSWKVRSEQAVGPAAEVIARFAEQERPDLIVMGTHGHSALVNVFLGSVVTGVLARCKRPVLLIP